MSLSGAVTNFFVNHSTWVISTIELVRVTKWEDKFHCKNRYFTKKNVTQKYRKKLLCVLLWIFFILRILFQLLGFFLQCRRTKLMEIDDVICMRTTPSYAQLSIWKRNLIDIQFRISPLPSDFGSIGRICTNCTGYPEGLPKHYWVETGNGPILSTLTATLRI